MAQLREAASQHAHTLIHVLLSVNSTTSKRATEANDSATKRQKQDEFTSAAEPGANPANQATNQLPEEPSATMSKVAAMTPPALAPASASTDQSEVLYQQLFKDSQSNDKATVLRALEKLTGIVISGTVGEAQAKENVTHVLELGGYTLVKLLLDKWIDDAPMQDQTIQFLINISYGDPSRSDRPVAQLHLSSLGASFGSN